MRPPIRSSTFCTPSPPNSRTTTPLRSGATVTPVHLPKKTYSTTLGMTRIHPSNSPNQPVLFQEPSLPGAALKIQSSEPHLASQLDRLPTVCLADPSQKILRVHPIATLRQLPYQDYSPTMRSFAQPLTQGDGGQENDLGAALFFPCRQGIADLLQGLFLAFLSGQGDGNDHGGCPE